MPGTRIRPAAQPAPEDPACRVEGAVVVEALGLPQSHGAVALRPAPLLACDMAKALAAWLDTSASPLAKGYFGQELTAISVGGGQECRRRNRSSTATLSEHATGKALDLIAFKIGSDPAPRTIQVATPSGPQEASFLTATRQSACGAFATVLGPGSDAAHADHIHLDIQQRRSAASRFCQ